VFESPENIRANEKAEKVLIGPSNSAINHRNVNEGKNDLRKATANQDPSHFSNITNQV
jgi:hypothetical protein